MLLEVTDLRVAYGKIEALKGVSFGVNEGEVVTLVGANGAGKTTTMRTISGLRTVIGGSIKFEGQDITNMPSHQRVKLGICQSPEGRGIFPGMTVRENLDMGTYTRVDHKSAAKNEDMERVMHLFPRLRERISQLGGTLSGGEQQMLSIARALARDIKVLLLDEPYEGLAPVIVQEIAKTLGIIRDQGITTIIVEQNAVAALKLADRAVILDTGTVVFDGSAKEVLDDAELRAKYLAI